MKSLRLYLVLLVYAVACIASGHAAPLRGRLAYIQNGAAYIVTLPNGKPKMLPHSRGAHLVSVAPRGGAILLFTTQKGGERAFLTRPPYVAVQALPKPLDTFEAGNAQWTGDGSSVLFAAWDKSYLWKVGTKSIISLPAGEATLSRDGRQVAFAAEKEIRVRQVGGQDRVLFSIYRPQPLFDALKKAKYPKNVRDLQGAISPDLWKEDNMWNFGSLAFSADGKTLWFACNAGTGAGAAGNTTYCWFACDLKTGRLAVLSKQGALFSRLPFDVQLSPDGKKLLYVTSVHSSAIENPCAASVMDLQTQISRDSLNWVENKKYDANLIDGTAWSLGSDAVAVSAIFYNLATVMKNENWEARERDHTLYIRDLRGKTLRTFRGAVQPSWGS